MKFKLIYFSSTSFSVNAKVCICKTRVLIKSISVEDDEGDKELLLDIVKRWNINCGDVDCKWWDDIGKSWLKPAILYSSPGRWVPPLDVDGSGNGVSIG